MPRPAQWFAIGSANPDRKATGQHAAVPGNDLDAAGRPRLIELIEEGVE
jgi:hypothetical protein